MRQRERKQIDNLSNNKEEEAGRGCRPLLFKGRSGGSLDEWWHISIFDSKNCQNRRRNAIFVTICKKIDVEDE